MKKYIHVNQHKIRANKKHGTDEPVIRYGGNDKPILSCGARVVIETEAEINILK